MTEEKTKKIVLVRYIGGHKFVAGVPARDLTPTEWASFSKKEQRHFIRLGLYEVIYGN